MFVERILIDFTYINNYISIKLILMRFNSLEVVEKRKNLMIENVDF